MPYFYGGLIPIPILAGQTNQAKTLAPLTCIWCLSVQLVLFGDIGACVFRCVASVTHLFCMLIGGYMNKKIPKKVIDIIGIELTPGEPTVCLGNSEQGGECCCDECDYYLFCFPEFDLKNKENNTAVSKK